MKVAKGAVIKNSIVMQDNIIGANASLDCVITDKNVVISDRENSAAASSSLFYPKGHDALTDTYAIIMSGIIICLT